MRVVILVPRRSDGGWRDKLWQFCRPWWAADHPDWEIVEGHHDDGPFNRSAAINAAAADAGVWDVAVIIDSDVLCDPRAVRSAVELAAARPVVVCAGHRQVHVNERGTRRVVAGWRGDWETQAESVYVDHWSSCIVVGRPLWELVQGYDPAFQGWGHEDDAFRYACETLGGHPLIKESATIWHLWHERARTVPALRLANRQRSDAYLAALGDPAAIAALRGPAAPLVLGPTRIPRILHRTVPAVTTPQVEEWWELWQALHPGWQFFTHRDPLDAADWPLTSPQWAACGSGAQLAGLIRLEALWRWGGVYVDSDVEPYRPLDALLHARGFAGWEDRNCVPDAVLGAEPEHPAVGLMLARAVEAVESGADAWSSGPGVSTGVLPFRGDWLLLPPGSFYPYHYRDKVRAGADHAAEQPWAFAAHHWAGSWLPADPPRTTRPAIRQAGGRRPRT